ncbi:hypothetical protein BDB00DRAFT_845831 [Zychaea mexicana]|uniref:uncharacterized protein n=1 Tax=Zychaea mexicana TaxID=64656 RepID=UPI0022FF359E|nr:uncharacterized protein BDB00DRAFT_845831 [Zychaea mexicana]KAI9488937.1 hypothetical protein BDB00DRAFT_845831 [Zychaea mexicana]
MSICFLFSFLFFLLFFFFRAAFAKRSVVLSSTRMIWRPLKSIIDCACGFVSMMILSAVFCLLNHINKPFTLVIKVLF